MAAEQMSNDRARDDVSKPGKVGSSRQPGVEKKGSLDFGIPARTANSLTDPYGRAKGPEQGTGPMRSGEEGRRTTGVGSSGGSDGSGSGGDLDPDIIGLDGRGGLSSRPPDRRADGADMTVGKTDPFASGGPATGKPAPPLPHTIGDRPALDTVDHGGGDITTTGDESDESSNPEIEEIQQESDLDRAPDEQSRTT